MAGKIRSHRGLTHLVSSLDKSRYQVEGEAAQQHAREIARSFA